MAGDEDLLDGLEGDAREARARLLERLRADGIPEPELRRAAEEDRLVLVAIERELRGEPKYTRAEMAEECGVDAEVLDIVRRAAGLPALPSGGRELSDADVDAGRRLKTALDAGLPLEGLVDANRVMGRALAQVAAAMRQVVAEAVLSDSRGEDEASERLAEAVHTLMPAIGPTMEHYFARHLLELIRTDVLGAEQLASRTLGGARETAVAFADLVGFTRLGGEVPAEDLGSIARRLEALTADAVGDEVRIIKTIGDAVMLSCSDAGRLTDAVLTLNDAVDAEGADFPQVRCGVALGSAVERNGDLYGHVVNLASRVTGLARPGSVLATEEVRDAAEAGGYAWSFAGEKKVKGVGEVKLFRARRAEDEPEGS